MHQLRAASEQHQAHQQELLRRIARLASPMAPGDLLTPEGVQQLVEEAVARREAHATAEAIRSKVGRRRGCSAVGFGLGRRRSRLAQAGCLPSAWTAQHMRAV
jgi:hypothetical protein